MRNYAYSISNIKVPKLSKPEAPILLNNSTPEKINWKGSGGASLYDVQKSATPVGPWLTIGSDISDSNKVFVKKDVSGAEMYDTKRPLFLDNKLFSGTNYYRVIAKNSAGISKPSNIVKVYVMPWSK